MKKLTFLFALLAFSLNAVCQGTFTEKNIYDFYNQYEKDPVVAWESTDENFQFISGNGARVSKTDLIKGAATMTDRHKYSDLKINQSGGTALVSGIIDQTMTQKNDPSKVRTYKGVFTAVYAYQKDKWVLMSWQHSDYKPSN